MVRIKFLDWRPDLEDFDNPGLSIATNVLHDSEGYKASRTMNTSSPLATNISGNGTALSVIAYEVTGGMDKIFTGGEQTEADRITYLVAAPFEDDVLRAGPMHTMGAAYAATVIGASYSTTSLQSFSFAEQGRYGLISLRHHTYSVTASPQSTTTAIGYFSKSTASGQYESTFTSLTVLDAGSNTAPPACIGSVGQFVMGGNLGAFSPDSAAVQWSAIGDPTDWPIPETDDARTKQSGKEQLNTEFGEVTHIGGDDFFAYAFQQKAITKFTYIGGDVVFTVDTFEEVRGAYTFGHVVRVDDKFFFESQHHRHVLENGVVQDLGYGAVDDTYPPDHTWGTRIEANPAIHTVFFTNGVRYNYKTGQFTYQPNITPVMSINDKNGIIGQWVNGTSMWFLTNSDGGTTETAKITTGAVDINEGGRVVVTGVRPIMNGGTPTVRVGAQNHPDGSITWSTSTSLNSRTNYGDLRIEGRYVRAEITIPDSFTTLTGADVEFAPQGKV